MTPEAVLIVTLILLAMAAILASVGALHEGPPDFVADAPTRAHGVPVSVICPRTTLPTKVELARALEDDYRLDVLACAEFGEADPSCHKACVSAPYPLVRA